MKIRRIPELRFQYDTTLDSAARIEAVLKEVLPLEEEPGHEGEGLGGGPETAETEAGGSE